MHSELTAAIGVGPARLRKCLLKRTYSALILLIVFSVPLSSWCLADSGRVLGARLWQSPEGTRLVFDVSQEISHSVFALQNPDRIVVDFRNARMATDIAKVNVTGSAIKSIRSGLRGANDLRIVLDVKTPFSPKAMALKPNREYGHRVVVDLLGTTPAPLVASPTPRVVKQAPRDRRDILVAVDAGHGGEDPGARGRRGTLEKDVVLAIARLLVDRLNREPGMKAVLVRDGDYYIGLRKRMNIARNAQADLFVSIHADAFKDQRAQGSSVFTLSARGASSEAARWLAVRENAADLVGGVTLEDKDDMLASVLLDLAQSASSDASSRIASYVLKGLQRVGRVHQSNVQQASFAVLKSPDVPSILVETAFISNPYEEAKLRSRQHQETIADAIFDGISTYYQRYPPAGTLVAETRRHTIERGETLSDIAQRYRISLDRLRLVNNLNNDSIYPGQILRIPGES